MTFNRLRKFLLIFIGALIGICFYISFSYAYYTGNASVGSSTGASASAEGDIVLIDNTAITLTGDKAVPISDSKALSSTNYRNQFQIRNDKKSTVNVDVYMVPTTATTMNSSAVKYALYDSAATKPSSGTMLVTNKYALSDAQKSYVTAKGYTPTSMGYKLGTFSLSTNASKTLNLYMWINYQENGTDKSTYNKYFEGVIFIKISSATSDMDGTFYQMMSSNASVDNASILSSTPTSSNSGLYLKNDTASTDYPIMYYRGIVSNNNVLFDGFCWKIVRTTEKGGIKLIYNGVPSGTTCNNTGEASQLSTTSAFNSSSTSPAYVGYMYGDVIGRSVYTRAYGSSTTLRFGKTISYSSANAEYTISTYVNYSTQSLISSSSYRTNVLRTYKYTCLSTASSCKYVNVVLYVSYSVPSSGGTISDRDLILYYIPLTAGQTVTTLKSAMFKNTTESTIKTIIDAWYEANLSDVTSKLEDTQWCNNRKVLSGTLYSPTSSTSNISPRFVDYNDSSTSSLTCANAVDRFSVDVANGNGNLDYPVGLLTSKEYYLAGSGRSVYSASSYLNTGVAQWTLSPAEYDGAYVVYLNASGVQATSSASSSYGVRPAIALKHTTKIASGDGSASNPYRVS